MSNLLKKKYIGRYIGVTSPNDGIVISDIVCLDTMLLNDNVFVLIGKTFFDWCIEPNEEWCIFKVYSTKERLLSENNGCHRLCDRIYAANWMKIIHID